MKRLKAIWNDPVASKVIAYLICGLLSLQLPQPHCTTHIYGNH